MKYLLTTLTTIMSVGVLTVVCALSIGFATSPSYASDTISCSSFEGCVADSSDVTNILLQMQAEITALQNDNAELKALLAGVSRGDDPNTSQDTLTFTNMNVQVVSGSGTTGGGVTGTGNLIIGYNEPRDETNATEPCPSDVVTEFWCNRRTGSHMLIIGLANNYTSYGGMVVGSGNETAAGYASVSGGASNTASGPGASVSGGQDNTASGVDSSVSGGQHNTASGLGASVSGGWFNEANGWVASVSGGEVNKANEESSSVSGGRRNTANGFASSVSGGQGNTVVAQYATAPQYTDADAVAAVGPHSLDTTTLLAGVTRGTDPNTSQDTLTFTDMNVQVVSGSGTTGGGVTGTGNLIIGYNELRGVDDDRTGSHMLVSGAGNSYKQYGGMVVGFNNTASGQYASVSGGLGNTASAHGASVSGGEGNKALGDFASVSGGFRNTASARSASVSGGENNTASAQNASVSGGGANTAGAHGASVSGGPSKTATTIWCTVAGNVGTDCGPVTYSISGTGLVGDGVSLDVLFDDDSQGRGFVVGGRVHSPGGAPDLWFRAGSSPTFPGPLDTFVQWSFGCFGGQCDPWEGAQDGSDNWMKAIRDGDGCVSWSQFTFDFASGVPPTLIDIPKYVERYDCADFSLADAVAAGELP